eukprot:7805031-Karenia_brevis.AAC.1
MPSWTCKFSRHIGQESCLGLVGSVTSSLFGRLVVHAIRLALPESPEGGQNQNNTTYPTYPKTK